MGVLDSLNAEASDRIHLQPGDTLLLMTDGFFEWMDHRSEQFGTARIFEVVRQMPEATAKELIEAIREQLRVFANDTPQNDDLTTIVIRRR